MHLTVQPEAGNHFPPVSFEGDSHNRASLTPVTQEINDIGNVGWQSTGKPRILAVVTPAADHIVAFI